jgi:murein L,D-transpeptidase YcbB/YkuD
VRVDQPLELAAWLLEDQPTWTRAKITTAMVAATPSSVRLRHKVPVVLYYATATVDPDGTVRFAGDPYGLDATLRRALDAPASE